MAVRFTGSINFRQLAQGAVAFLLCLNFAANYAFAEGDITNLKQFEYWDNGKIKRCTMYDTNGRLKAKAFCRYDGTVEKIERFDEAGNRTEEVLYDEKGRLRTGIDGWAAARWWYYGSWLVSQITYDEVGKPIERKQYSESGNLVLRQYKDNERLDTYENAAMFKLLGARNMRYIDPKENLVEKAGLN